MVESKKIIVEKIEFEEVILDKKDYQKAQSKRIDKKRDKLDYPLEEIDKIREEERWKKELSNYLLNPRKFDFGLKNL